jgi:hypothetical protein
MAKHFRHIPVPRANPRIPGFQQTDSVGEPMRGTLGNEIVTFHFSFYVAIIPFHQALKRGIRRKTVLPLGRFCSGRLGKGAERAGVEIQRTN